ncbi:MAG: carbon-nitrogen hydrolase [Planctomycetaceae bacterium]|nr:carbon-nitrogen hydrolase [Planctomycetaceae bacterium]
MNATNSHSVSVAVLQMQCVQDKSANLRRAEHQVRTAAGQGARIICLQELFHGLYPCQAEDHALFAEAEPIPGPICERFGRLAGELEIVLVLSMFEKRTAGLYHNTAVVFDADGRQCGLYRKMHIPDDPLFYEKFYFTPGDLGFRSFQTRYGKIGVCVCWDQWFPEAARLTALTGAEILFYPTAIGWHPSEKAEFGVSQHAAWETMMRSHAIANGVFVAAPNRVGLEGNIEFWGGSFLCDPYGNLLKKAGHDAEEILIASCDFSLLDTARTHWPFLRDRRIDAYAGLTKRFLDAFPDA